VHPIKGLVCGSSQGKLVVKLATGETARVPKREGIMVGDNVLLGYDFGTGRINHIIPNQHGALREKHEPQVKYERPSEEPLGEQPSFEDMGVLLQGNEEFEELEVDDFEVLRFLSQGSEDSGFSTGE